jgi:hypothetical protein
MTTDGDARRAFDEAMCDLYTRAVREANYNPTLYLRMLTEYGPLDTARRLRRRARGRPH